MITFRFLLLFGSYVHMQLSCSSSDDDWNIDDGPAPGCRFAAPVTPQGVADKSSSEDFNLSSGGGEGGSGLEATRPGSSRDSDRRPVASGHVEAEQHAVVPPARGDGIVARARKPTGSKDFSKIILKVVYNVAHGALHMTDTSRAAAFGYIPQSVTNTYEGGSFFFLVQSPSHIGGQTFIKRCASVFHLIPEPRRQCSKRVHTPAKVR